MPLHDSRTAPLTGSGQPVRKPDFPSCFWRANRGRRSRASRSATQLTMIVDHMGVASDVVQAGRIANAIDHTASLAKYPNVSVKLSSAPLMSKEPYPYRDVNPHIRRLFEAYGPQRCYWGTDLTNSFSKATYRQRVTHFTEELSFLSEDDKDWVMGRAILARLKWS